MHQRIKRTLEAIIILISTVILTNCKMTKEQTSAINNPQKEIQQKIEYKTFYLENQQSYKTELKDYQQAIKYKNYIEPEYRIIIETPEKFPEVLEI